MTSATLQPLAAYDIDQHRGFVPAHDPLARLPGRFDAWEALIPEMSALIRTRRLRDALAALPTLSTDNLATEAERERALLLLTVFANGWVWSGQGPDLQIPAPVAVPLCALATQLDRPPIVHYASMALHNWQRVDSARELSSDNARMQVQFLGGVDEDWFFIGSIGVELAGAPLLPCVHAIALASHHDDDATLAGLLETLTAGMAPVLQALERMREWCDPHVFYHRVRPFLAGWPDPGVIYQGVSSLPQKHVGGSAGQSSLIQAIDAVLSIDHGDSMSGRYLRDVRRYMPGGHRRFVVEVGQASRARVRAAAGAPRLRQAYNAALDQVSRFRQAHIDLAVHYVVKPSGMAERAKGTGGTVLADFLGEAQRRTEAMKVAL